MKKLFDNTKFLIILVIVVFFAGIFLGILIVGLFPILNHQKPGYVDHSYKIAAEYLDGRYDELEKMKNIYSHFFILDEHGEVVRSATYDEHHTVEDFMDYLGKWVPDVLSGREIFAITESKFTPSLLHFWVTVGVPALKDGKVEGAVFMISNLQNLPEAVLGYTIFFTILYWFSAALLFIYRVRKRRLDELQQTYIANVTHALKTPNASISAMAEALCDDVITDPDKQKLYYGMILQETAIQNRMVQEILDLSRLQSRQTDLTKEWIPSEEMLKPILEKYTVLCDCTDVTLHVSDAVRSLPPLYTNTACFTQILELLLDNAIKFVPENGDVWIDAQQNGHQVQLTIRDNGIGISKEDLPHIFERFYRCNRSDSYRNGSGLGLAIVKELVDGLDEKIRVESTLGEGTSFYVTVHA